MSIRLLAAFGFPIRHTIPAVTFRPATLLLRASFIRWRSEVSLNRADTCPGYKADNVKRTASSLKADLTLVGTPCNVYGKDLYELQFLAEWQTGTLDVIWDALLQHNRLFHYFPLFSSSKTYN